MTYFGGGRQIITVWKLMKLVSVRIPEEVITMLLVVGDVVVVPGQNLVIVVVVLIILVVLVQSKRRKKMNRFNYGLLAGVVAVMPVFSLGAQEVGQCAIKPTCASMGYQQKAADCTGKNMLKCPFDNTIVFCGGTACAADFTLSSCDSSKGTCEECGGKYKYTSCSGNFTLSNGNCVCNKSCSNGYTLNSSFCSCICNITSCGSNQFLSGCKCIPCTSACSLYKQARTSGPYTLEECKAFNNSWSTTSYVCHGKTYYACYEETGDMCWDEY